MTYRLITIAATTVAALIGYRTGRVLAEALCWELDMARMTHPDTPMRIKVAR